MIPSLVSIWHNANLIESQVINIDFSDGSKTSAVFALNMVLYGDRKIQALYLIISGSSIFLSAIPAALNRNKKNCL